MATDSILAKGFIFRPKKESAPNFVVGSLSIKTSDAIETLKAHTKGEWVNMNVKISKGGNYYVEIDTWEPTSTQQNESSTYSEEGISSEVISDSEEAEVSDLEDGDLLF